MKNIVISRLKQYLLPYVIYDHIKKIPRIVLRRKPLRNKKNNNLNKPFFIIGSGRSGNTLLRALISNHPEVVIPPESYVLGKVIRKYHLINWMEWEDISRLVLSTFESHKHFYTWDLNVQELYLKLFEIENNDKNLARIINDLYMFYGKVHKPKAIRWGDKTPLNTFSLNKIKKVFPESKYIHIIRDGRDVVNSYINSGIYTSVVDATERWKKSINLSVKFGEKVGPNNYLEVRYEDLVMKPYDEIKKVCDFLELDFFDDMLDNQKNFEKLGDTVALNHHSNVKKPISTSSIGKYKEELTEAEINQINILAKNELKKTKYK